MLCLKSLTNFAETFFDSGKQGYSEAQPSQPGVSGFHATVAPAQNSGQQPVRNHHTNFSAQNLAPVSQVVNSETNGGVQIQRPSIGQNQNPKPSIPSHLQQRIASNAQQMQNNAQQLQASLPNRSLGLSHAIPGSASQQAAGLSQPIGTKSGKAVSINDIQKVQNYIEKCLQLYLSQKEVNLSI